MNLGDAKRKVLKLLDESTAMAITQDPLSKFIDYFDMAQKEIAIILPIIKTATITKVVTDSSVEWVEQSLPSDFREVVKVHGENNGRWIGKKFFLRYDDEGTFIVEYKAYPATLDEATLDSYEFEIATEALQALIYFTAAQCEVKEYNLNYYDNYMSLYNTSMANLVNNKRVGVTFVKIGDA